MLNFIFEFSKITIISERHLSRYLSFIESRQNRFLPKNAFIEKHHILPQSYYPEFIKTESNIIKLTVREHFIAHILLANAVGSRMWEALFYMAHSKPSHYGRHEYTLSSRCYERCKIEASKSISIRIKASRSNETEEQKQNRISKWKNTIDNKAKEEKEASRIKSRESRKFVEYPHRETSLCCLMCRKEFRLISKFSLHAEKCYEKLLKREQNKLLKIHRIVSCVFCKSSFTSENRFQNHTNLCKERKIIKKERRSRQGIDEEKLLKKLANDKRKLESRKNKTCEKCITFFTSKQAYENHIAVNNCHLTKEEKKKLSRQRAAETMHNRSEEEKKNASLKLSKKRYEFLENRSEEDKNKTSVALSNSGKKYYNSDRYDPLVKSQQVKNGFHAKNIKH